MNRSFSKSPRPFSPTAGKATPAEKSLLWALILAGGKGRRFWPKSRECLPKQLLAIGCDQPMVRETVRRLLPLIPPERILVSAGEELGQELKKLLPEIPTQNFLLEPIGRDTAAAIGLALARFRANSGADPTREILAVLPADHVINHPSRFRRTLVKAGEAAQRGLIVTIGIPPDRPSPAYGYLQPGAELPGLKGVRRVKRFVEKPDVKTAAKYLARGYLWNAGMFIFRRDVMETAYQRFLPEMTAGLHRIARAFQTSRPGPPIRREFLRFPKISIDYAVMEKAENVAVVPGDFGWCDVGGWEACYRLEGGDGQKNVIKGPGEFLDSRGCYVESQKFTALVGVDDLVVIETADALLILRRDQEAALKKLTERLEKKRLGHLL